MSRLAGGSPTLVATSALLAACGSEAPPVRATALAGIAPAHCVDTLASGNAADPLRCPAALLAAVAEAVPACRDAGGKLAGTPEGNVWALDVNDDGRQELLFELDGNVVCENAWSVFSCGSLGCPKGLYELRDGAWTVIGGVSAGAPEQVTLGTSSAADGHRTLEVCSDDGCAARWIYEWLGASYDVVHADVRGARVEVASSVHGLYPLVAPTTVRATPTGDGVDVGHYDAGTEVAIIGTAAGGDYYYVSPCNACDSGFVPSSAVAVP